MLTWEIPSQRLSGVQFSTYSAEEICRLSVKEITNPQTFDNLLHPTTGGLYDPALGPTDRDDLCGTCAQNYLHCPGHMGHVNLPLPVFNPLFLRLLYQMLRGSCFYCHRLMCPKIQAQLITSQLKVLDHGLVQMVEKLHGVLSGILEEEGEADDDYIAQQLQEEAQKAISGVDTKMTQTQQNMKTAVGKRKDLVKEFTKDYFKKRGTRCLHCKSPVRNLKMQHNSRILFKGIPKRHFKKKYEDGEEGEDEIGEGEQKDWLADKLDVKNVITDSTVESGYLTPYEARAHLRALWKNEGELLSNLFGALRLVPQGTCPIDIFFLEVLPVPPSRFRPVSVLGDKRFENAQTSNLAKVLAECVVARKLLQEMGKEEGEDTKTGGKTILNEISGTTVTEKVNNVWLRLQTSVNRVMDSDLDKLSNDRSPGIKQLIEKKDGLFRKHMMGKRVDYAARSVISPDPYINMDEIGIPLVFATKLTYPQPVTAWNVRELRQAVINGPNVHPGAAFVVNENGHKTVLSVSDPTQREAIAKQLLTPSSYPGAAMGTKIVHRHIKNGDVLLLNRQPTLHKPSIMAHKARILPGEKTLRLHYANCKTYNADFDGDEMNAHFPQNELGRAEAYAIASTDQQYLGPKDGKPLSGLIQDHMVSGVTMTLRGRFFPREEYQQLVFSALTDKQGHVRLLPPSIVKPHRLWSGKQVVSTVLLNIIPEGKAPLNMDSKSKISGKLWVTAPPRRSRSRVRPLCDDEMCESQVVIRQGELLCGILDKGHYGPTPYGLVHCCSELYGGKVSSRLLTCLGRLFTTFLQNHLGFTLGVEDILLTQKADVKRREIMTAAALCGDDAAARALGMDTGVKVESDTLKEALQTAHFSPDDQDMKEWDMAMKSKTDQFSNDINKACTPNGLLKMFPHNNLQLMVQSGAKGSSVNCMQISSLLGQIELEGRRPPLMPSGSSLPSFLPYDTSPRAGGFVDGRFLTGIRPQEYFFHCMAGREGLVDTAVKTSRSGYLQRCIIKHLEGLVINYDLTVRDSDGSLIQFYYGEDGLDIPKTQFLGPKHFPFMVNNHQAVMQQKQLQLVQDRMDTTAAAAWQRKVNKWKKKQKKKGLLNSRERRSAFLSYCEKEQPSLREEYPGVDSNSGRLKAAVAAVDLWKDMQEEDREKYRKQNKKCPDPTIAKLRPDRHFGSMSELYSDILNEYVATNPMGLPSEDDVSAAGEMTIDRFHAMMQYKYMRSLVEPGEAVGLLAAQSIGEPSTQMTLNTFHFAGRGEMNVTLGIPRLREILMVASANIKTPTMEVPLVDSPEARTAAENIRRRFTQVHLFQVLESVEVSETLSVESRFERFRIYTLRFQFLPAETYQKDVYLSPAKILHFMERKFFRRLLDALKRQAKEMQEHKLLNSRERRNILDIDDDDGDDDDEGEPDEPVQVTNKKPPTEEDSSEEEDNDGDATAVKQKQKHSQDQDYDEKGESDPEEEDREEEDEEEEEDETGNKPSPKSPSPETGEEEKAEEDRPETPATPTDEKMKKKKKKKRKEREAVQDEIRINAVLAMSPQISGYSYDAQDEEWCEIKLQLDIVGSKFDMTSLVEREAHKAVVHQTPGITRCFLSDSKLPGEEGVIRLKTEGVNLQELFKYDRVFDLNKLCSNHIHAMANTYGIEAACRIIVKEIKEVFAVYGIEVDPRHLSLVADYMTYEGVYKPFNRTGIQSNASPFQQMSFETSMQFLKEATISGAKDDLKSPSARLVTGRPVMGGTGCFELLQPLV
ncbi:PREDICTED: DNA-directed RNA polymerase I subunit RPA1-like isoform X3 [Branchiostoma belcheri]|uniref:DNA-directed RNA polymerase subunit n=1 Tax=Branchiostoma belcheri TaxID=7741 RepID=A0A6P4ZHE3_BRABE|nr:PREDICTED: DNA-directed RNA polymerase I subunit RPA1-like isoform X3 [Branchiostoma belcheri]